MGSRRHKLFIIQLSFFFSPFRICHIYLPQDTKVPSYIRLRLRSICDYWLSNFYRLLASTLTQSSFFLPPPRVHFPRY